ncbi:GIY-YIG nuclease family protein [Aspergillus brunneoviolaceus CBS 621.78]|uniref:DUF1766-domain-containing protein n=1 Tax=Aspergillus brunneoviolaceus CBS 621.78 TaxID=1450534 RepID=A0ACD1GPU4_9EURO|nr:DUF1766-domain-containing protein [Aspergillus brunneoviolaceus CBS 621.78]RAH51139.1 DUF1766-domain-containing protein [Aspergillus brunneoviolaceus CBS 621.78]
MCPACPGPSIVPFRTPARFTLVHCPAPSSAGSDLYKSNCQEQPPPTCQPLGKTCTLRTRLGLRYRKCGQRCTSTGTACTKSITKKNRDQIETLITSMVLLCQASTGLISKMEELSALANCHSHRRKDPEDARKAKWMAAFPARPSDVRYVEVQVTELLGSPFTICGAKTESDLCPNKIGGRMVQNLQRIMTKSILKKNMYCSAHELNTHFNRGDCSKSKILGICTTAGFSVGLPTRSEAPNEPECKSLGSEFTEHCDGSSFQGQQKSSLGIPEDSALVLLEGFDTTPFQILPRTNRRGTKTLNDYFQEKVRRDLRSRHGISGNIYAFQAKSDPGYIKIGYTTGPVLEHLRSFIFGCNREMKVLFPTSPEFGNSVPNAWRVEELCHAELVDDQVQVDCTGCLSEHREWFQISAADAFAVIKNLVCVDENHAI